MAPYEKLLTALRAAILGEGKLDRAIRAAIVAGETLPDDLRAFVDTVKRHAYRVTDEDVDALKKTRSEDEIFEATIAAAYAAAEHRRKAAVRAMARDA